MTNLQLKRQIDNTLTEITHLIADECLSRAWQKYQAMCDLIEYDGLGWDDEAINYWRIATDKAYGECRTAENLALGLLPSYSPASVQNGAPEEAYTPELDYSDFGFEDEPVDVRHEVRHDA